MTTSTFVKPDFHTMFVKPEEIGKPASLVVMGDYGTRKTTTLGLIATVPEYKDANILMLDFEGGAKVFASEPGIKQAIEDDRFHIVPIDVTDPLAYDKIVYFLGEVDEFNIFNKGAAFTSGYDVIIIDSLDAVQGVMVNWYTAHTFTEKGELNTLGGHGRVKQWTIGLSWALHNAPMLALITVHVEEKASETGKLSIGPLLSGAARGIVGGIFDAVFFLEKERDPAFPKDADKARIVATMEGDGTVKAKNRWRLPAKIVDFSIPKFFDMIRTQESPTPAAPAASTEGESA